MTRSAHVGRVGHGDGEPDVRVVARQPLVDELAEEAESQRIAVARDVELGPRRVWQRGAHFAPLRAWCALSASKPSSIRVHQVAGKASS